MNKWIRKYRLTVEPTSRSELYTGPLKLIPGATDQIIISNPITIEFHVQRNPFSQTSSTVIRLFNLNEERREALYKDIFSGHLYRPVILQAGYDEPLPILFAGNMQSCSSSRVEGSTNYITEIRASDMTYAVKNSFSSWTMGEELVDRNRVISQLVGDLNVYGLKKGILSDFTKLYPRGRTVCGFTWEALQKETGGLAYIDNSNIHALKDDDAFIGSFPEISSETGLLATPRRWEKGVEVEMLFEPRLEVGQNVILRSRARVYQAFDKKELCKVVGLLHSGMISDAVAGKCKTTVQLYLGRKTINVLSGTQI